MGHLDHGGFHDPGRLPRWSSSLANPSRRKHYFIPFVVTFVVLFATTGIGNGSTFRMIPIIFSKEQAGPSTWLDVSDRRLWRLPDPEDFRHADQGRHTGIRAVRLRRLLRQLPGRELVVLRPAQRGN